MRTPAWYFLMSAVCLVVGASAAAGGATAAFCTGDCNADGAVAIDELMIGVNLALGEPSSPACAAAFCASDCGPGPAPHPPRIDCLLRAVHAALTGCPTTRCRVDADCDDGNACSADTCTAVGCVSECLCL